MQISAYALEFEITRSRTPSPLKHKSFSNEWEEGIFPHALPP